MTVTGKQIVEQGCFDEFCEMFGFYEFSIGENLIWDDDEFELTKEQAIKLGFINESLLRIRPDQV